MPKKKPRKGTSHKSTPIIRSTLIFLSITLKFEQEAAGSYQSLPSLQVFAAVMLHRCSPARIILGRFLGVVWGFYFNFLFDRYVFYPELF